MKTGSQSKKQKFGRYLTAISAIVVAGGVLAGCGSSSGTTAGTSASPSPGASTASDQINGGNPITISVFQWAASISDTEFKNLIADPVNKKWPNVTLQLVRAKGAASINELTASGNFPEITFTDSLSLSPYLDLNILEDMSPYIKKYSLDTSVYVPRAITQIQSYGDKGQMYGLPFSLNFGVLYYNKSIFDKSALSYPKDGNTYDDLIQISKQISGKQTDGIQPLAINGGFSRLAVSLLLPAYDPKTKKASLQTDEWRNAIQMFLNIVKVPGNQLLDNKEIKRFQDGNVAMLTSYGARVGEFEDMLNKGQDLDWDMATFPVMKDSKNPGMETESHMLAISTTSKNKDDDFKIIKFLTTDHNLQETVSRAARESALNDPALQKVFGSDLKTLKGKHIDAIFKNKYGTMPAQTQEEIAALNAVCKEVTQVMVPGKEDINTGLRVAEEKANAAIANISAK